MTDLRVLSYNVQSLRGSPPHLVAAIRAADPHVVCVQEAPRFLFAGRKARALARACGLRVAAGGRSAMELLVLARPDVEVAGRLSRKFPWRPPLHRRGFAAAVVRVGGAEVTVGSFHLGLDPAERLAHARWIASYAGQAGPAVVVAGDVNETPGQPAWSALEDGLRDAYAAAQHGPGETFPAGSPRRRIDGVFVGPAFDVVRCEVPGTPAAAAGSDHRPVLATIRVR